MTLGEKIYQLRRKQGYSQEELADKLNISRQSVSLWENNQTVPQIDYLIELSRLFNITLDELCGNNIYDKKEENEKNIDPILSTNFEFNENKANQIIKILHSKLQIAFILCVNILFISIMLVTHMIKEILFIDILINIIVVTFFMRNNMKNKKILLKEKHNVQISFYEEYFLIFSQSLNNESKYNVSYKEVTNLYITDELLIIVFNNKYSVVDIVSLGEHKEKIIEKLKINAKKIVNQTSINSSKLKSWSRILFIGCFASIILAIILFGIVNQTNKYAFSEGTFVLNSWVFYIASIIPISSFVFGLIFRKRFKCKKNIITGIIFSIILCIYGSFFIIFSSFFKFDKEYFENINKKVNIEFPQEYLLVTETLNLGYETKIKFTNEEEIVVFENNIKTSPLWDDTENLPNDFSLFIINRVSKYDIYYIYELDGEMYNDGKEVDKLLFTYNFENNILLINEIYCDMINQ